jgi:hypothetical protein
MAANNSNTVNQQNQSDQVMSFLLPANFNDLRGAGLQLGSLTGLDMNRHIQIHQIPVSASQQQQQNAINPTLIQALPKQDSMQPNHSNKQVKNQQRVNNQQQQQQQQQLLTHHQQIAPHLLTTASIAFPGNPLQQNQHNVQTQQQHTIQIIPASAASTQVRNNNAVSFTSGLANIQPALCWPCPACKIPFKSASELQTHLSAHTKAEKSVPCQQCGKLFASAERVRIHIRVAHGEKSCACEICGSGFSYRCKLLDHMRTHTGDKPFHCEVCSRSFSQKNHLRRHQMIHTGERPFPCEVCGRGFYRKDKLSRHRRIHLNPGGVGARNARNANNAIAATTTQHIVAQVGQNQQATIQLIPVQMAQFRNAPLTSAATQQWVTASTAQQLNLASNTVNTVAIEAPSNSSNPTTSS